MTSEAPPILFSGLPGSPYTRKMLAVLRYRRLPYRFIAQGDAVARGLPQPKVPLLPTFYFPNAQGTLEPVTDSTPLIRRLEEAAPARGILPPDPALAFLDRLLEDYGDEWLTKAMFHYRWAYAADAAQAGQILPFYRGTARADAEVAEQGRLFAERQIGRLYVVGSNPTTGPVIEAAYVRFIERLNDHLRSHRFLMGSRPGASDFAMYGQLTQLALFDPTPVALTLELAPRVRAWCEMTEDLSGAEPTASDWLDAKALPASLRAILTEAGRTYVPVMLANAAALAAGQTEVKTVVDGAAWVQQAFPYQGKCLRWLREAYAALDPTARATVDAALAGTGCEALVRP